MPVTIAISMGVRPHKDTICGPVRIPPGKWELELEHHKDSCMVLQFQDSEMRHEVKSGYLIHSEGAVVNVSFDEVGSEEYINLIARKVK